VVLALWVLLWRGGRESEGRMFAKISREFIALTLSGRKIWIPTDRILGLEVEDADTVVVTFQVTRVLDGQGNSQVYEELQVRLRDTGLGDYCEVRLNQKTTAGPYEAEIVE